jgi:hypothetical protein
MVFHAVLMPTYQCGDLVRDTDRGPADARPVNATATAVHPTLCPGTSANSDTASAFMNAVSAAEARMRWIWAPPLASRSEETEIATKSRPIRAPVTPALARKKSCVLSGTTR